MDIHSGSFLSGMMVRLFVYPSSFILLSERPSWSAISLGIEVLSMAVSVDR